MKRKKLGKSESRKVFKRNSGSAPKNSLSNPMRGGIRL